MGAEKLVGPGGLLTSAAVVERGGRRVKSLVSGYVSPMASRLARQGKADDAVARLLKARRLVDRGATLLEIVADGTASGWDLRMALSNVLGLALANWDAQPGRTRLERAAVVERALGELGEKTRKLEVVR